MHASLTTNKNAFSNLSTQIKQMREIHKLFTEKVNERLNSKVEEKDFKDFKSHSRGYVHQNDLDEFKGKIKPLCEQVRCDME